VLATLVNKLIAGVYFKGSPEMSWRYVLLCGLVPVAFAIFVRFFVREPERWHAVREKADKARVGLAELFRPENRAILISGLIPAVTVLIAWWSTNAFISIYAAALAKQSPEIAGLTKPQVQAFIAHYQEIANYSFNFGGLAGTLLTVPAAYLLGRRKMYLAYLVGASLSYFALFGLQLPVIWQLYGFVLPGLTIFGVFGSFTFYLPELFPTRLRATGSGFCYNIGRVAASIGPFVVGIIAKDGLDAMRHALFIVGIIPLVGVALLPWVIETRGQALRDEEM